jgi:Rad3-related DNA helicase
MKTLRIVKGLTLALAIGLAGCGLGKNKKAAEAEVDRFHQHWNASEFQAVFDEAHLQFRAAQSAETMITTMQTLKKNYGDLKSSKRRGFGFTSNEGATDIKLSYDSAFEDGAAVETFLFRMTGGKALLVSYDIVTPETAARQEAETKQLTEAKRKAREEERKATRDAEKKARETDKSKP